MKAALNRILLALRAARGGDSSRSRALARRAAATSIQWPDKTVFLMNPNPEVRDRVAVVILATFVGIVLMKAISVSPLPRYIADRALRPHMEAAMQAGNPGAATWLGSRFQTDYPGLLEAEADAGEPNAMYLVGRALMRGASAPRYYPRAASMTREQQRALGLDFVQRAADAGNEAALLLLVNRGERLSADEKVPTQLASEGYPRLPRAEASAGDAYSACVAGRVLAQSPNAVRYDERSGSVPPAGPQTIEQAVLRGIAAIGNQEAPLVLLESDQHLHISRSWCWPIDTWAGAPFAGEPTLIGSN
jgi:hypothetical protein